MGLPELAGDPCWIFANGPYDLEKRNAIRIEAENRSFVRIQRGLRGLVIFEFDEQVGKI